ncbi:MAG: response regulator [Candidatus Acidiferrum sp.]
MVSQPVVSFFLFLVGLHLKWREVAPFSYILNGVLLVDDEPSILAYYSRALANAGFEVTKAGGSDEALNRVGSATFDIVVADLLVPEESGFALLAELHALSPNLPVIVMVDQLSNELAVEVADLAALQSLVKPIDRALLNRTVGHAVRLKQARKPDVNASVEQKRTSRP